MILLMRPARLLAVLIVAAPLAALGAGPLAARLATPSSPHGKFRGECADCHAANAWKPARISARFDHARFGFALEGAHAAAQCTSCHASLDFTQEKQRCVSCHEDVHRGELGVECARCHTSRSFIDRGAMLHLHQVSRFPLSGAHAGLECEDCHRPQAAGHMRFVGTRADCAGCHIADFRAADAPNHVTGGFPTDCMSCHTTSDWHRARFNHDLTGFPLSGAHRTLACATCHTSGTFQGLSATCVSCHLADYNGTSDPAHAAAGFSTQCQTCHTTSSWAGATFDHDASFFPIYSGRHAGLWSNCSTCHTNSGSFAQFTCFSCHPHDDQTGTDSHHTGVSGYRYDSQACYACHPRGRIG